MLKKLVAAVLALASLPALAQLPAPLKTDVTKRVDGMYPWLDTVYKDLHAHPEIAFQEVRTAGKLAAESLTVTSRMNEGGVVFADGIEQDFLAFDWGRRVAIAPAARTLNLVVA